MNSGAPVASTVEVENEEEVGVEEFNPDTWSGRAARAL